MVDIKNKKVVIVYVVAIVLLIAFSVIGNNGFLSNKENKDIECVRKKLDLVDSLIYFNVELVDENIFKDCGKPVDKALEYYSKAVINLKKNKLDSVLFFCNTSLDYIAGKEYPFLEARIYREKGSYYKNFGDYFQSMEYLLKSLDYFENEEPESYFLGRVYSSLGGLNFGLQRIDLAKEYYEKSYKIALNHNSFLGRVVYHANMGNIYLYNRELGEAEKALFSGLNNFEELKDTVNMITALNNISLVKVYENSFDKALEFVDSALKLSEEINNPMLQAITYINYGNIYKELKDYETGIIYYTKSLEIASGKQLLRQKRDALLRLSEIYSLYDKKDLAYDFLIEFYEVNEVIEGKDINIKIEDLKTEVFRSQSDMYKNQAEKNQRKSKSYAISGILVLCFTIVLLMLYRTKNKLLVLTRQENIYLNEKIKTEKEIKRLHKKQHEFENKAKEELQELKQKQHSIELDAKDRELTILNLKLISKSKLLNEIEDIIGDKDQSVDINQLQNIIRQNRNHEKEWKQFKEIFRAIHPTFFEAIEKNYPQLTKAEIRICAYIKINMSNEEISIILNISQSSLMTNRYRIRKKLNLDRTELLEEVIKSW